MHVVVIPWIIKNGGAESCDHVIIESSIGTSSSKLSIASLIFGPAYKVLSVSDSI